MIISNEVMLLAQQTRAKLAPLIAELIRNYTTEAQAGVLGRIFLKAESRADDMVQQMNFVIAQAIVAGNAASPVATVGEIAPSEKWISEFIRWIDFAETLDIETEKRQVACAFGEASSVAPLSAALRLDPVTLEAIAERMAGLDNTMLHQDKLAAFVRSLAGAGR